MYWAANKVKIAKARKEVYRRKKEEMAENSGRAAGGDHRNRPSRVWE